MGELDGPREHQDGSDRKNVISESGRPLVVVPRESVCSERHVREENEDESEVEPVPKVGRVELKSMLLHGGEFVKRET